MKKKVLIPIIIVLAIAACIGIFFLCRTLIKRPEPSEPSVETTIATEASTEETETTEEPTTEEIEKDYYISFKDREDIPESITDEQILIDENNDLNVKYSDLVDAAKWEEDYELNVTDKDGNNLTISAFNTLDSDTGKVSVKSFSKETSEMVETYDNLSLEEFKRLTGSLDPDEIWETTYEEVYEEHYSEETSVVVHEHDYRGSVDIQPGCETEGVYRFTCSICGDTYTEPMSPIGHELSGSVTVEPTCTQTGLITYTCSRCSHVEYKEVPVREHYYVGRITVKPTCNKEGIKTYTCEDCGSSYTESVPKTSHEWHQMQTYTVTCTACGKTFVSNGTIDDAAEAWQAHADAAHGSEEADADVSVESGEGEVCIHCGAVR